MRQDRFAPDSAVAARCAELSLAIGPALNREVAGLLADGSVARGSPGAAAIARLARNAGGVIERADAERLVDRFQLRSTRELALLALPTAVDRARPPISEYRVGAVGIEAETGDLVVGGNIEFPATSLGYTIHAEGAVALRAASRGTTIATLAVTRARPCAHCRQFLAEFDVGRRLEIIDPLGHAVGLTDLYPWPFDPEALGEPGIVAGAVPSADLSIADSRVPADVASRLVAAGRRAHAPYSRSPAAVVLTVRGGGMVAGATIESVAFNPSVGPLQAAIVDLHAHALEMTDVTGAYLARTDGGRADPEAGTRELLAALAPGVPLVVAAWGPAGHAI